MPLIVEEAVRRLC